MIIQQIALIIIIVIVVEEALKDEVDPGSVVYSSNVNSL